MPEERWRCFVAVPISDELRTALHEYVAELRQLPWADGWRWTDPAGWHVTLAFLGDIAPSSVPEIAKALREVAARRSVFTVPTGGFGVFPSSQRPRVLWYGVDDPSGQLAALATDVRAALHVVHSPFRGHITVARKRDRGHAAVIAHGLVRVGAPSYEVDVDSLILHRTSLGKNSQYELVRKTQIPAKRAKRREFGLS